MDGIIQIFGVGVLGMMLVAIQAQLGSALNLIDIALIITVFRGDKNRAIGLAIWCSILEGVLTGTLIASLLVHCIVVVVSLAVCQRFLVARSLPALLMLGGGMTIVGAIIRYVAIPLTASGFSELWWYALGWQSVLSFGLLLLVNSGVLALWYGLWYHPRHGVRAFVVGG